MKRCPTCDNEKPETEFAPNKSRKDGRQAHCRPCYAEYQREYYRRRTQTDPAYRERQKALRRGRRLRLAQANRRQLWAYFETHPCTDCGESDPWVLDLDHTDPSSKSFAIGNAILHRPWDEIASEIALCDVRCANCHRRRTALQLGFYQYVPSDGT